MKRTTIPSKSRSPHRTTPTKQSTPPPQPAQPVPVHYHKQLPLKLKNNRQKLTHTLDTYTMLIRSNHPIRCLEHNSAVSIYCETQNKLLCTNCIFDSRQHKFHKVSAIDKSYQKIQAGCSSMQIIVQNQIRTLHSIQKAIQEYLLKEQDQTHRVLGTLAIRYDQAHQLLDQSFHRAKLKILEYSQEIKVRSQTVAVELGFLQKVYDTDQSIINENSFLHTQEQLLMYKHALNHTITSQNRFDGNIWKLPQSQIKVFSQSQLIKVDKICQNLMIQLSLLK